MLNLDLPALLAKIRGSVEQPGDVLLTVGCPPSVSTGGGLVPARVEGLERLTPFQVEGVVLHLLASAAPTAGERLREAGAVHFAYSVPGVNRYRVSVFSQRGTLAVVLRTIPDAVPTLSSLGLPEEVSVACQELDGLVLVNGPVSAGRTTSLAAMTAEINRSRSCHVVTIEDPIEYLHRHDRAIVNQRQVGVDTPSLAAGLSDAGRHGAAVVMVSELGSAEEAREALELAETGTLVLTTLRGFDTASALRRLVTLLPPDERAETRSRLTRVLRWSFTQRLVVHRSGVRPVVEIWRSTRDTRAQLESGALDSQAVADTLRDGEADGLVGFDRELERRVRGGEIDREAALAVAVLPRQLELRLLDVQEARR